MPSHDLRLTAGMQEDTIAANEYELLVKAPRAAAPPPLPSDELSRWVPEAAWAALQPLTQLPVFAGLVSLVCGAHAFMR